MDTKHVFITGATGCIGHYVVQELLKVPHYHLHLFVRDPKRLKLDLPDNAPISFVIGDMTKIEAQKEILDTMDYLIHIATPWGNCEGTIQTNVTKSLELFSMMNQDRLKRIIYFSTASILNEDNTPSKAAKESGTPYIKSKYLMHEAIQTLPYKDKIISVFPTAVLGGSNTIPKSHLYDGIPKSIHYLKWLRWFSIDASFHFLHTADIAKMVKLLIDYPGEQREFVLGRPFVSYSTLLKSLCHAYSTKIWITIPIPTRAIYGLIKLFKVKLSSWDRHCVEKRHFKHKVSSPADFGLQPQFSSIDDVFKDLKKLS